MKGNDTYQIPSDAYFELWEDLRRTHCSASGQGLDRFTGMMVKVAAAVFHAQHGRWPTVDEIKALLVVKPGERV